MCIFVRNSFKNNEYISYDDENLKEYLKWVKYYLLKMMIESDKYKLLLKNENIEIFEYLDIGIEVLANEEKVYKILNEKYEEIKNNLQPILLDKNIEKLNKIIELTNYEKEILKFFIIITMENVLQEAADIYGRDLNILQVKLILSKLLNIELPLVDKAISNDSTLIQSNLLEVYKEDTHYFYKKLNIINESFSENMIFSDIDILEMFKEYIKPMDNSTLFFEDYPHLKKDINNIISFLSKTPNGNILLYGLAGTGKTELTKLLAKTLNKKIYEISYLDENDEPIRSSQRLRNYKFAQYIFKNSNTIILYDEAEDIFDDAIQKAYKAWINRSLENNFVSTIWISNDIRFADRAILRRFDYILEVPIPPKKVRKQIIKKYYSTLSDKTIKKLSSHKYLSPAVISRAIDVWKKTNSSEKELIRIINHTLIAQGYSKIVKKEKKPKQKSDLPNFYNIEFINSDIDIKNLVKGLEYSNRANICIYGIPGTGKSAFGKYIAQKLNKSLIIKKGSDLLSAYVGGTEKNIARAFKEAKEKNGVLIFDEVDTFLQDRKTAMRSWEISQVNEMLTQMEEFDGIFIATTNLMDNLDDASLRRFDIKIEFKSLNPIQIKNLTNSILEEFKLEKNKNIIDKIMSLNNLTFGDFNTIIKQHKINPIISIEDFYNRLLQELKVKSLNTNSIGFLGKVG